MQRCLKDKSVWCKKPDWLISFGKELRPQSRAWIERERERGQREKKEILWFDLLQKAQRSPPRYRLSFEIASIVRFFACGVVLKSVHTDLVCFQFLLFFIDTSFSQCRGLRKSQEGKLRHRLIGGYCFVVVRFTSTQIESDSREEKSQNKMKLRTVPQDTCCSPEKQMFQAVLS